jgi:hypothetical protein
MMLNWINPWFKSILSYVLLPRIAITLGLPSYLAASIKMALTGRDYPRRLALSDRLAPSYHAGLASAGGATCLTTTTCELRWDFLEEESMMQYSRDKYFS